MLVVETVPVVALTNRAYGKLAITLALSAPAFSTSLSSIGDSPDRGPGGLRWGIVLLGLLLRRHAGRGTGESQQLVNWIPTFTASADGESALRTESWLCVG